MRETGIGVLLIDDHHLIREGLRRAFEADGGFTVVGEAGSAAAGLAQASARHPEVALVDVHLPDGSGIELTRQLRDRLPCCAIVVLTMYAGDEYLLAALEAGASAFVTKTISAQEVVAAARVAAADPLEFRATGLTTALRRRASTAISQLSQREQQVLELLAEGLRIEQIARQLYVSTSTTKTHIARVYDKLGAENRSQALLSAIRLGLIQVPRHPIF